MKNNEAFRAAVYAKAEAKRKQIKARRRSVRNVSVSALGMLAAAAVMVPFARSHITPVSPAAAVTTPPTQVVTVTQPPLFSGDANTRMVLLSNSDGEDAVVVLDTEEQKKDFVSKHKETNNISAATGPPVTPSYDGAKTIRSTDELVEYLAALPQDTKALQEAVSGFDETFFSENELCVLPVEIREVEAILEDVMLAGGESLSPILVEPLQPDDMTEPTTDEFATETTDEFGETETAVETTGDAAPPALAEPYLLLLIPKNK